MSDRLTGLLVLIVALAFFASATQLEMPFFSDPLGPKAFPMLISSVAIISAIFLITKPEIKNRSGQHLAHFTNFFLRH